FLHHDRGLGDAEARPAISLRSRDAEPAVAGDRRGEIVREPAVAVAVEPVAVVVRLADASHCFLYRALLLAQGEVHCLSPWFCQLSGRTVGRQSSAARSNTLAMRRRSRKRSLRITLRCAITGAAAPVSVSVESSCTVGVASGISRS